MTNEKPNKFHVAEQKGFSREGQYVKQVIFCFLCKGQQNLMREQLRDDHNGELKEERYVCTSCKKW